MESLIVFVLTFLLPSQLAYHFWPQFSYILGLRVDYLSPTLFLTDILVILLLPHLIGLIKRTNKNKLKNISFSFLFLLLFSLLNIIFADFPIISLFKWVTALKLILLGFYFYLCDLRKLGKAIYLGLSSSLIFFSLIGFLQFIFQRTIGGPFVLLGERAFTSATSGIALMSFFGRSLMRIYSTFPHPNSFAGFIVVSFLLILFLNKVFLKKKLSGKFYFLSLVVILSLLLTASFNALIGILVMMVFYFLSEKYKKFIKKTRVFLPAVLITLSITFGSVAAAFPGSFRLSSSVRERLVLANDSLGVFTEKPLLGVGLNNFFSFTKNTQPPHNVFLLILSETGIVGILVVFFLLFNLLKRSLNEYLFLAILFVLITSLFDHYWFTLQQNQLLLALLISLSLRRNTSDKEKSEKYNT